MDGVGLNCAIGFNECCITSGVIWLVCVSAITAIGTAIIGRFRYDCNIISDILAA